jgi:GTP cyclohydrolase I/GTP cyclohydrolase-4
MSNSMRPGDLVLADDVQASQPAVHLSLSKAGVTGVHQVIRICHGGEETVYYADIECSVDLDPAHKGAHMSRFAEVFAEAIESVVIGEALAIEDLAGQIATRVLGRQGALRSFARIEAKFPVSRTTPVSGLQSQEIYTLIGVASATAAGTRRAIGVRVRGLNACPCAQGMVRELASGRLADLGYHGDEQTRILDAIPLATHNQRAEAELLIGSEQFIPAEQLIEIAESSMSAPILALLKRPDELYVVEQAHMHPMFVEDSVRAMVQGVIERYPELEDEAFVSAHQVNFETIHNHDVVAERTGLLGELRDEVLHDGVSDTHVSLDGWLARG